MKHLLVAFALTVVSTSAFAKNCSIQARQIGQIKANEYIAKLNEGYKMFDSIKIKTRNAAYIQINESNTKTYFYEATVKYVDKQFTDFDAQVVIELDKQCKLISSSVDEISAE